MNYITNNSLSCCIYRPGQEQTVVISLKRLGKIMNHLPVYALLMFVFCISAKGQNKPELSKDDTKSETKVVVTSIPTGMNRTIKQDRNGTFGLLHMMVFIGTMVNPLSML